MRTFLLLTALTPAVFAQSTDPLVSGAKQVYGTAKNYVLRSAEKMPEDKYAFKPSPDVRAYGQVLGHIADDQYVFCGPVKGEKGPQKDLEKAVHSKAETVSALREAFAYCDSAWAGVSDADAAKTLSFFNQDRSKLNILWFNTAHTLEHYGNLVTYLRINGIVPPSSEPPPNASKKGETKK